MREVSKFARIALCILLQTVVCSAATKAPGTPPSCRFAPSYSQADILRDPSGFISDYLYWENRFHANNISYNTDNGMSYDGTQLNFTTGLATEKHPFSAASKESLQLMVYAQALSGSEYATRFISPDQPHQAYQIVVNILKTKLDTYLRFNETFPGFGGMIPWFLANETNIRPTQDWVNRVPALDNGELLWAAYAVVEALQSCPWADHDDKVTSLAEGWQQWLDYAKSTAATIFYQGNGSVCAVTSLRNQSEPMTANQNYSCQTDGRLDDPYEGELFTWWLYFFGGLSDADKGALWVAKRPKLKSVEYNMGGIGPITVEEGFWFSAHEPWKLLEMPYTDVDLVRRLGHNAERARTCNSLITTTPGLYASVNNITNVTTGELDDYISAAGIPSIANQTKQYLEVVTPYAVWPVMMVNQTVAVAWLRNMLAGGKMQIKSSSYSYGTTESELASGKGVSAFVSWDSKVTTVASLSHGVQDLVRAKMKKDGIYDEFLQVLDREYSRVFTELKGEDVELCLPGVPIGDGGLGDFSACT